jgi:hypothetical protein
LDNFLAVSRLWEVDLNVDVLSEFGSLKSVRKEWRVERNGGPVMIGWNSIGGILMGGMVLGGEAGLRSLIGP